MIKIALVGNIASGKSTVEDILSDFGFKVLDCDKVCHSLLDDQDVRAFFKEYDVFDGDVISRKKLANLVFFDPSLKFQLENILYPKLRNEINKFFENNAFEKMVFVAIPLLYEAQMEDLFDRVLFVYCDDKIREQRLIARNNYSKEYAAVRMNAQISQDEKVRKADFVIYNNSTVEELEKNLTKLIEQIH